MTHIEKVRTKYSAAVIFLLYCGKEQIVPPAISDSGELEKFSKCGNSQTPSVSCRASPSNITLTKCEAVAQDVLISLLKDVESSGWQLMQPGETRLTQISILELFGHSLTTTVKRLLVQLQRLQSDYGSFSSVTQSLY